MVSSIYCCQEKKSNITSINFSAENEPLSKARDLEDELEDDEDEGNAEELNLPKNDLEISSELDETRTSPETSSKNSQVTGRPKWKKGKRKEPETTAKQLEKKELEFMSAVTEMVGQTNATDPDTAFANLILSHVRQLPKRLKFSCQNEINQVFFRHMMYSVANRLAYLLIICFLLSMSHKTPKPRIRDISQICIEAALFLSI